MCNKYKKGNISNCYKHWNNRSGFCFPWLSDLPSWGIKCLTDVLLTRVLILFCIRREGREEHAVLWRGTQESYVGEIRMSKAVILSAWMLKPRGQGASAWMGGLDPMCTAGKAPPPTLPALPALIPQYPLSGTWQQQGLECPEKPKGLEAFGSSPPMDSWQSI